MLSRLANVFRVPDLRNKVIFTLAIIALYQIGANVPVPGVTGATCSPSRARRRRRACSASSTCSAAVRWSAWPCSASASCPTSPAPSSFSCSRTVIPKLEEWRDQGAVGQKKITQTTRYLTVALALMQSSGLVYAFHGHDSALLGTSIDLIPKFTFALAAFMVLS